MVSSPVASGSRSRLLLAGASLAVAALAGVAIVRFLQGPPRNIVLIVVDTLRSDVLGCYGGEARTPHIDALAAAGKRYDPVVGSFHQTSSSTGALFLGVTPSLENGQGGTLPWNGRTWCGMYRFGTGEAGSDCLPKSLPTLAERLKADGFRTIGVVANNLLFKPAGFDRGFDVWQEIGAREAKTSDLDLATYARRAGESRNSRHVVPAALEAVRQHASEKFFLYLHLMDVHDWFIPGDPSHSAKIVANYPLAVEEMDAQLGVLLDGLESLGVLENSTVILVADHGESLGETHPLPSLPTHDGNPAYETVARIPLVVRPPAKRWPLAPTITLPDAPLLRTQDVHGLVLKIAGDDGAAPPTQLAGDEYFYTEMFYRTLRRGRWKLTCARGNAVPAVCAMFDLQSDPHESIDVAPEHPDVLAAMRSRMAELAGLLAPGAEPAAPGALSEQDRERLQALGYLH